MIPTCLDCGSPVYWDYTCHTYGEGDKFFACLPCDSAVEYSCTADDCYWSYTHGLNPHNPRAARNEEQRPPWCPDGELGWKDGFSPKVADGVPYVEDVEWPDE